MNKYEGVEEMLLVDLSLVDEGLALADVALELGDGSINETLLVLVDLADGVDLGNTLRAELDVGGEVLNT